ncbi:MAG: chromosome segregation protein SMC [Desulfosarcinaceae bacterium]|nr:chromosome segregation protein SMC [Desulfosarcinaceae bacterium]
MKLKKLELVGFKSFPEKAIISFPEGISAVVGPNGCGKSNIVDALRWVMGEQSIKQLRGKDKEDIIFSGSNGRAPTNLAEVSVTLANDNGHAPEAFRDYSEIMITRRLFRSGETGYLINKQPCRLKDIHNIFMGSGMGARTYSVIQQGNIGAITDAGPDERRHFLEEAAGVTRYKARKVETLRKIKATNQNLLRVSDIVSEVQRQMGGLKRQANKAERFKALQKQIARLDTQLLLHQFDRLTGDIEKARALLKALRDTDLAHTTRLNKIDAAVEEIKLRRWQKNQEIAQQKTRQHEVQRQLDRTESELRHARTEVDRLGEEIHELEKAHQELGSKEAQIQGEITQVETRTAELRTRILSLRERIDQERTGSKALRSELEAQSSIQEKGKAEVMQLVADEARYRNIYQTATSNRENLRRRLKRIDEEEALAAQKVRLAEEDVAARTAELEEIRTDIVALEERIQACRTKLDVEARRLGAQVKKTQQLEYDRTKARSRLTALKKMAESLEWYRGGARAILQLRQAEDQPAGGQTDQLPAADVPTHLREGILGLVADGLEPTPAYTTAVEAALGEALQYIAVKNTRVGAAGLTYLQEHRAGRSGFIPVTDLTPLPLCAEATAPKPARLLDHVRVHPGFEKIAEILLGHVVVADDLTTAQALAAKGKGAYQAIVTRDGDMIAPSGILIGGSTENMAGILTKKQELRDLEALCAEFDNQVARAHTDQAAFEAAVRDCEIELQQTIERKNHATEAATEAEKSLYRAGENHKQACRHLEITRLEQEQLLGEESDIDAEMEKYHRALAGIEAEVTAAKQAMESSARRASELSAQLEAHNALVVDLQLKLTQSTAELENSTATLKRLQSFQLDGVQRREQTAREIGQKREKRAHQQRQIGEYERLLAELIQQIRALQDRLEDDENHYAEIDQRLQSSDRKISEIRDEREQNLQQLRVVELELSEKQIKRESVENRSQERYHCSIAVLRGRAVATDADKDQSPEEMAETLADYRNRLARIGDVNLGAIEEFKHLKERFDFLSEQREDLEQAIADLHKVIQRINKITQEKFMATFEAVNEKLKEVFPKLFTGGRAWLALTDPNDLLESGVEYMVHPAGKKLTRMSLMSGGEKALSAIAFIFSIFLLRPTSFCLLDEIDAPLDDANVQRFNDLLKLIGKKTQIIMITHNKNSMEFADMLFGITMETKGVSKVVSVDLQRAS